MANRRFAALVAVAAVVFAACSSSAATTAPSAAGGGGSAAGCTVGVSWNNYQEERWAKWDEPAIKAALDAAGAKYISNDAKSSAETQATNVENLISQGGQGHHRPRPGRHGHQAVGRERDQPGHPGDRL